MKKIKTPVRPADEPSINSESFHSQIGYWTEGEAYEISAQQAQEFRRAAQSLTRVFQQTMDIVTNYDKYAERFVFTGRKKDDRRIYDFVSRAWQEREHNYLLDRWDMAWDGVSPPKLLERNMGYTGLIAGTASVQEEYIHWLSQQDGYADVKSFGNLQSAFVQAFRRAAEEFAMPVNAEIAVAVGENNANSDPGMVRAAEILCRWIKRAGYEPVKIETNALSFAKGTIFAIINVPEETRTRWLKELRQQHDVVLLETTAVACIKQKFCFPFAHADAYAQSRALSTWTPPEQKKTMAEVLSLIQSKQQNIEPAVLQPSWALLMGHKALLAIMSELYPDHPNLLPSSFSRDAMGDHPYIVKQVNSCQGIGSKIVGAGGKLLANRRYQKRQEQYPYRHVYQRYADACQEPEGGSRVFHLFTVDDQPAALGARVAPGRFVGGDDTQTKYMPVLVRSGGSLLRQEF